MKSKFKLTNENNSCESISISKLYCVKLYVKLMFMNFTCCSYNIVPELKFHVTISSNQNCTWTRLEESTKLVNYKERRCETSTKKKAITGKISCTIICHVYKVVNLTKYFYLVK